MPSDPVATPVTPERVFKDDPATAFSVLDGMGFWCGLPGAEDGYLIGFEGASSLSVEYYEGSSDQMPDIGSGSYSVAGTRVTLDIPALMFNASSDDFAVALDRVVAFQFSAEGLVCSARVLDLSMSSDAQVFECPTIAFVPGAGFDNNEFQMALNGRVLRRRWKEITVGDGDTLYREFRGIYVIEQGSVFMVFPEADEAADQLLYGPVASDLSQFTVEQLEPDKGPCTAK